MEEETILYFYPEEKRAAKKFLWSKAKLMGMEVSTKEEDLCLFLYAIPEYYFAQKKWDNEKLKECMEDVIQECNATCCYLNPSINRLLHFKEKSPPTYVIEKLFAGNNCWENVIIVGVNSESADWEEQEALYVLLKKYLVRINRITIVTSLPKVYEEMEQWFYEEYGIPTSFTKKLENLGQCRKKTTILDWRREYEPLCGHLPKGAVYIDIHSDNAKEVCINRERPDISYLSPVNFLDTLVKNRYTILVN